MCCVYVAQKCRLPSPFISTLSNLLTLPPSLLSCLTSILFSVLLQFECITCVCSVCACAVGGVMIDSYSIVYTLSNYITIQSWKFMLGGLFIYIVERIVRFIRSLQQVVIIKVCVSLPPPSPPPLSNIHPLPTAHSSLSFPCPSLPFLPHPLPSVLCSVCFHCPSIIASPLMAPLFSLHLPSCPSPSCPCPYIIASPPLLITPPSCPSPSYPCHSIIALPLLYLPFYCCPSPSFKCLLSCTLPLQCRSLRIHPRQLRSRWRREASRQRPASMCSSTFPLWPCLSGTHLHWPQ